MPGMMISRENRKYQLRRLTKSIFRMRGGARTASMAGGTTACSWVVGGSACSSSSSSVSSSSSSDASVFSIPGCVSSGCSDTIHPHQRRAPEAAASHDDRQQVVGDDDRGDQADADADPERDRKTLDRSRPDEAEDEAGDDGRQVGVPDRRPCPPDAGINGGRYGPARAHFLFESLEDQNLGVDGHADREDEPGDPGQRQRDGHELEGGEYRPRVEEQGKAR